jgi:DSF synthase
MGASVNTVVEFPVLTTKSIYKQLDLEYSPDNHTLFSWMKPAPRPCFTRTMLDEINKCESLLESHQGYISQAGQPSRVQYVVFGNRTPGVFNLGGDLDMFVNAILSQDRAAIHEYARLCVDLIYRRHIGFGSNISTIALVQGKALGGGFECALACDVIIAERSATFSLPESLFNLFPGMGALTFLARKLGLARAEQICTSAEVYTATDLHALGVVDVLAEDGLGMAVARRYIANRNRHANTYRSLKVAKRFVQPVSLQELHDVVDVWTDAALRLEARDLRMMMRLVKAQDRIISSVTAEDDLVSSMYGATLDRVVNG